MKVIGKSEQGYLLTATEGEIANLFGFYWAGDDKFRALLDEKLGRNGTHRSDLIGLVINSSVAYEQLSWIRRRDREFDDLVNALRKTAGTRRSGSGIRSNRRSTSRCRTRGRNDHANG